jgi:cytoskeletal protein CcmA (bactofilin family)
MKIVHTGDPGILSLRSEVVGCVVFVGLLFIAGGGFTVALALDRLPIEVSFNPELKNIALAVGALVAMLGLIFVGGRSGKIFDPRRQSLISWSGFLVPMRRKHQRIDGYSWVVLVKEVRKGKNSSTTLFPVRLEGDRGPALHIDTCTDSLEARRLAEAVAKVLRLPLTDSMSGEAVIREPDHLDESLRGRMRRLGERVEIPSRPHTMRSQIQVTSSEVVAELPGMSTKARLIMNVVVIVFVLGVGFAFFGTELITGTETGTQRQAESTKPADRKSEPKTVARSEPVRTGGTGDRANIGRSITIKGDISGDEDLHIQGTVDGSVNLKEYNVTIDPEGRVKADVHGRTITVQGQVEGDLFGGEQVILRPSCRVSGNITAPRVSLEDGANFRGTIDMEANSGGTTSAVQRPSAEQSSALRPSIVQTSDSSNAVKADGKKP